MRDVAMLSHIAPAPMCFTSLLLFSSASGLRHLGCKYALSKVSISNTYLYILKDLGE